MKKVVALLVVGLIFISLNGCGKKQDVATLDEPGKLLDESETALIDESIGTKMQAGIAQVAETAQTTAQGIVPTAQQAATAAMDVVKPTIKQIQTALANAGLYTGKIDGVLGPGTSKAIRDFQAQNNLAIDGKVGTKTWELLKAYLVKTLSAAMATGK